MKNTIRIKAIRRIAGIAVLVAVIGFSLVACGDDSGGGGGPVIPTFPTFSEAEKNGLIAQASTALSEQPNSAPIDDFETAMTALWDVVPLLADRLSSLSGGIYEDAQGRMMPPIMGGATSHTDNLNFEDAGCATLRGYLGSYGIDDLEGPYKISASAGSNGAVGSYSMNFNDFSFTYGSDDDNDQDDFTLPNLVKADAKGTGSITGSWNMNAPVLTMTSSVAISYAFVFIDGTYNGYGFLNLGGVVTQHADNPMSPDFEPVGTPALSGNIEVFPKGQAEPFRHTFTHTQLLQIFDLD